MASNQPQDHQVRIDIQDVNPVAPPQEKTWLRFFSHLCQRRPSPSASIVPAFTGSAGLTESSTPSTLSRTQRPTLAARSSQFFTEYLLGKWALFDKDAEERYQETVWASNALVMKVCNCKRSLQCLYKLTSSVAVFRQCRFL